jgi:hypothetical protein
VGAHFVGVDALSGLELAESSHKAVMYHAHQLQKLDTGAACQLLRQYLVQRLALHGNEQWIEATLTTLVWMSTSLECSIEIATTLEATFTQIREKWTKSLGAEATRIVLVLLWRQMELGSNYDKFGDAAVWCQLAMHPLLFDNLDDLNAGKIQRYATPRTAPQRMILLISCRKLLQCLLKQSKFEEAHKVALALSIAVQHHPLSRYLTYCIAIRVNDDDLGESVLLADGPSIPEAKSDGVPLACVSETLRYKPDNEGAICKVFSKGSLTFCEWHYPKLIVQSHNTCLHRAVSRYLR